MRFENFIKQNFDNEKKIKFRSQENFIIHKIEDMNRKRSVFYFRNLVFVGLFLFIVFIPVFKSVTNLNIKGEDFNIWLWPNFNELDAEMVSVYYQ